VPLERLRIESLRCLAEVELVLDPRRNYVYGPNGAGKTSLLEGIYLLGRGRSFRTRETRRLVRRGADGFAVYGEVSGGRRLGVGYGATGLQLRMDARPAEGIGELARVLPVHVIDPSLHQLIEGGPSERRRFLDWGVFHVEHGFQGVWQRYARALRQRNTLLRAGAERAEAAPWERELVEAGLEIDGYRRRYLAAIEPMLARLGESLLGSGEAVGVEYQQGWPVASDFADALARNWARDQQAGSTQAGPHRADLAVRVGSHKVQDRVSRGQQKVLAGALILAQLGEFQRRTGRRAALLADDLPAELDPAFLDRFVAAARETGSQLFVTAIRRDNVPASLLDRARMFHVEHGRIGAALRAAD
jgi:DNA replication and repair protein RecF